MLATAIEIVVAFITASITYDLIKTENRKLLLEDLRLRDFSKNSILAKLYTAIAVAWYIWTIQGIIGLLLS